MVEHWIASQSAWGGSRTRSEYKGSIDQGLAALQRWHSDRQAGTMGDGLGAHLHAHVLYAVPQFCSLQLGTSKSTSWADAAALCRASQSQRRPALL